MLKTDTPSPAFCDAILRAYNRCAQSHTRPDIGQIWEAIIREAHDTGDLGGALTAMFAWDSRPKHSLTFNNRMMDIFQAVERGCVPGLRARRDTGLGLIIERDTA